MSKGWASTDYQDWQHVIQKWTDWRLALHTVDLQTYKAIRPQVFGGHPVLLFSSLRLPIWFDPVSSQLSLHTHMLRRQDALTWMPTVLKSPPAILR